MTTDYLFVGAGVANLAAANCLLDTGQSSLVVLEKGLPLKARRCPGLPQKTCHHCRTDCPVIHGAGGANALFGNKLCYFPASAAVISALAPNILGRSAAYLERLLSPYFDSKYIREERAFSIRKDYYADVLSQKQFAEMVGRMTHRLETTNRLRFRTPVTDITRIDGRFCVSTGSGEKFRTRTLVLGTGRTSQHWFRGVMNNLDITYSELLPDVGIRIEADAANFGSNYYYQVDPKFRFDFAPHGSARTFCAHNRGVVVPVEFGSSFYADGAFPAKFTTENNIALMTRTHEPVSLERLETWCREVNRSGGGVLH